MNEQKINKEAGINFDYILALESKNGTLSIEKIDILRHDSLIDEMFEMYENPHDDAGDMYRRARNSNWTTGYTFPYCLGHSYYDSYIDEIAFPEINADYQRVINDKQNHISNCYKNGYIDYANKLQSQLNAFIKKSKEKYLINILQYIYSYDYSNTLRQHKVKEKYKIFSSEIHGRFSYETVVNDELKILTRTNFCYGSSSYFHIIVKYKDIELLPLSEWVKYYHAGYNSIMRFTRSYFCQRKSWKYAMEFLESFVNRAIENPDEFVKNDVLLEVNGLMAGLEEIFLMTEMEFEKRLDVKHIYDDDIRYIGISSARHANDRERQNYKIKKTESAMIYKMEKISGALQFLNNLKTISTIIPEVESSISRIIELNKTIYPEVIEAIPPIELEIKNLSRELNKIERKYNLKEQQLDYLKKRLENIKKKSFGSGKDTKQVEEEFESNNPQFKILTKEIYELCQEQNKYLTLIHNREDVKKRLSSYKELIEKVE